MRTLLTTIGESPGLTEWILKRCRHPLGQAGGLQEVPGKDGRVGEELHDRRGVPLAVGNGWGNDVARDPSGRAEGAQPGRRLFRRRWRGDLSDRLSLARHQDWPPCALHLGQESETGGLEPGNRYPALSYRKHHPD